MERDSHRTSDRQNDSVKIEDDSDSNDGNSIPSASKEDEQKYFEKFGELREKMRTKWRIEQAYRTKREQVREHEKAIEEANAAYRRLERNVMVLRHQYRTIEESAEAYQNMVDGGVERILQIRQELEAEKVAAARAEDREGSTLGDLAAAYLRK